jgi:hypothetical protein
MNDGRFRHYFPYFPYRRFVYERKQPQVNGSSGIIVPIFSKGTIGKERLVYVEWLYACFLKRYSGKPNYIVNYII